MDIELAQTLAENELLKSLLYCTKRSCNNCGKVSCENFQRQRIDCCGNWVSYKDYIKQLEEEKDKAWWEGFDTCKAKAGEANVKLSEELETERKKNAELTEQIEELKCCANCKYEEQGYMIEPCKSCNRYFPTLKVGARDKWEKR